MGLNNFWPYKFGFKPLLGLEPRAPILPQLLASHVNHSATETSHVFIYVCMLLCMHVCYKVFLLAAACGNWFCGSNPFSRV